MLATFTIGAGFGVVAGLQRQGRERATMSADVGLTTLKAAVVFLVVGWLAVVAIRFARSLRK